MSKGRLLFGLFIISIGACFGLDTLIGLPFRESFNYVWPVFLMIWGLSFIFERRFDFYKLIVFFVGGYFFLNNFFSFNENISIWRVFWSVIIIAFGFSLIFKRQHIVKPDSSAKVDVSALFGGKNVIINNEFSYAECNAVFGGSELNLIDAIFLGDPVIEANAVFGGIEIMLPKSIRLIINGTPVFGGIENKTENTVLPDDAVTLTINASAVFGGIVIKN